MENNDFITREEFKTLEERVRNIEADNKLFVYQYKDIKETLGIIKEDINEIKQADAQNWRRTKNVVMDKVVTGIVGALAGGVLALILK